MTARVWVAAAIVLVPLIGYPLVTLASGSPRFPSDAECVRPALNDQPIDLVYGRFDDPESAAEARDRIVAVGFTGTEVLPDGCGSWKVVLEGVPSLEIAREIQAEAATVDLSATLELGSDD